VRKSFLKSDNDRRYGRQYAYIAREQIGLQPFTVLLDVKTRNSIFINRMLRRAQTPDNEKFTVNEKFKLNSLRQHTVTHGLYV